MSEVLNVVRAVRPLPYRAMETRVFEELAAAGFADLTPAQARVFQRIAPEGSRLTDLPHRLRSPSRARASSSTSSERNGYVERVPDPADGRARLVRIAERGTRSVEASRGIVAQVEAEWTAHLGERRMTQLRRILADLREVTDPARRSPTRPPFGDGADQPIVVGRRAGRVASNVVMSSACRSVRPMSSRPSSRRQRV